MLAAILCNLIPAPRPGGGPFWRKYGYDDDRILEAEVPQIPEPALKPVVEAGAVEPAPIYFPPVPQPVRFSDNLRQVKAPKRRKRTKIVDKSNDQAEDDEILVVLSMIM